MSLRGQDYEEKIFDAAWSGDRKPDPRTGSIVPIGCTVDAKTATYANTIGSDVLSAVWEDPDFAPDSAAIYYVRVLEIPTPRWSTIAAAKGGMSVPSDVPWQIQQRGWTSPIWYRPSP